MTSEVIPGTSRTVASPGAGENITLRGLAHSVDLRTLALWAAPAAQLIEQDLGPTDAAHTLEGLWDVFIEISGGYGADEAVLAIRFDFRPDHTIKATGPTAEDGLPGYIGVGWWLCLPGGSFVFGIHNPGVPDGAGGSTGAIYAAHLGEITGETFSSRSCAIIDLSDGKPYIGPIPVRATGSRVSE
jgi:hypothetical protein